MAKVKSVEEVETLKVKAKSKAGKKRSFPFQQEIEELKKGEGLEILDTEWTLKTPISNYYYSKFTKGSISAIKTEKGTTIIKNR